MNMLLGISCIKKVAVYLIEANICLLESWILLWNFATIIGSLMRPKWLKLGSLVHNVYKLYTSSSLVYSLRPTGYP